MPADVPDWSKVSTVPLLETPGDPQPYSAQANGNYSYAFPIPKGAQSLRFKVKWGAGIQIASWQVTGDVSGAFTSYWGLANQTFVGAASLDITFRTYAVDSIVTLSFQIVANTGNPIQFLAEASTALGDVAVEVVGNQGTSTAQPFTVEVVNPQPQYVPNKPTVPIVATLANGGGSVSLVTGVAGQHLYPFYCHLTQDTLVSTTVELQDDTGAPRDEWDTNQPGLSPGWYGGQDWGAGRGAKLVNTGPVATTVRGGFTHSQA